MTLEELRACTRAALTVTEVAEVFGLDPRTVRRACEDGQLPALYVGRRVLIPRDRLLSLLTAPNSSGMPLDEPPRANTSTRTENRHV